MIAAKSGDLFAKSAKQNAKGHARLSQAFGSFGTCVVSGGGLQIRLLRFESGRGLSTKDLAF
jgi:hypothetical protein